MKIECPHCQGLIELKVKGAKKKEKAPTMPKEVLSALTSHYLSIKKAVNNPAVSSQLGRIYKGVKNLYLLCNEDLEVAKQKLTLADVYFANMGCSWQIETLLKPEHFSRLGETDNAYKGWS